ncbi:MAG: tRNA-dihydrouridine synthase family protein [Polyangiaceae bacterium]
MSEPTIEPASPVLRGAPEPGAVPRRWPPGRLSLAPMDGVTDWVYRELVTARATPGTLAFCVSEFVRVVQRPVSLILLQRAYPEAARGGLTRAGVPVMLQLLGGSPGAIAETARQAIELGAWGIDLNFGCPAKTVNRHDGGATLLKAPERIERIVSAVRAAVPRDRAVSVKVRLGWQSSDEVEAIARAAERGGASWLTVHGRTKLDMYGPPADWSAIGRARRAVGITVIANGDLNAEGSIARCAEQSGCDHFMLGRGAMGRPALFGAADGEHELAELLLEYMEALAAAGNSEGRQVGRVKQWLALGKKANPALAPMFEHIKLCETRTGLAERLTET